MVSKSAILLYIAIASSGIGLVKYSQNKSDNPPEVISRIINLEDKIWEIGIPSELKFDEELLQCTTRLDSLESIPGVKNEVKEYKLKYRRLEALGVALAISPLLYIVFRGKKAFG
jgi:hypothetical protein